MVDSQPASLKAGYGYQEPTRTLELVLVTSGFSLKRLKPASWSEYRSLMLKLISAPRQPIYDLLARLVDAKVLRAIVAVGDDPLLEYVVGRNLVIYVYGSPWRIKCPRCGATARLTVDKLVKLEAGPRCSICGTPMVPEPGDEPIQRFLEEAVAAVLSATHTVFASIDEANYLVVGLALLASRMRVRVYCDSTLPAWIPCSRFKDVESLLSLLAVEASAHGR
jgi:hypothetical protein